MNLRRLTYTLLIACVTANLCSCSGGAPRRDTLETRLEGLSSPEAVAAGKSLIDSVAQVSADSIRPLVRKIAGILKARGDVAGATEIAAYPYGIDASQRPDIASRLLVATLLPGTQAPALEVRDYGGEGDGGSMMPSGSPRVIAFSGADAARKGAILFFYESSCRSCQGMMDELIRRYPDLTEAGVRVITISSDKESQREGYFEYIRRFPWPDRLCDFMGFESPNFIRYGVAGTPVLFYVDGKGVVVNEFGSAEAILDLILPTK